MKKKSQNRVWWFLFLRCCRSTLSEHAPTAATAQSTVAFNFHEINEEKLENLQLQYHERICVYLSSSSIQISPRFLFSSKLYLGLLSQNPYVTWLHRAEAYAALYRVSTIKVSERTLTSVKEKYKYSAPLRHWAWHLLPVSFNWWPKPAAFTARRY